MKKIITFVLLIFIASYIFCQDNKALEIIKQLDANNIFKTIKYEGEMTIYISSKKYVKSFYSYGSGTKNFFIEFTNQDDAGTKYLKKDGNLYVYSPDSEEIIPITGHMLKESMMGSDMSYEDTLNNETLEAQYNSSLIGEEEVNGKQCFILELIGKKKTIQYPKQKIWVDKENITALKIELFALSGAKIKEENILEVKKIGNRFFAVNSEMKDLLRKNSKTVFKMNKVELDVKLPDNIFSMKSLEK